MNPTLKFSLFRNNGWLAKSVTPPFLAPSSDASLVTEPERVWRVERALPLSG